MAKPALGEISRSTRIISSRKSWRERLDVSAVGAFGIGHDRGRIRVRQNHFVALLLESFAGLRAGVVELRRLADDDGARAEDQNLLYVSSFGHVSILDLSYL